MHRTMRMLSFYGDSSFETENTDAEQDLQMRIFLEIQRRLPELLNRKITNYVTNLNTVSQESYNIIPQSTATSRPTTTTSTSRPTTTTRTTTPRARLSQATPREFFTYRSDAVPSTISFKRPRPTNFDNLHRSLSSSYSYHHNYDQQVDETYFLFNNVAPLNYVEKLPGKLQFQPININKKVLSGVNQQFLGWRTSLQHQLCCDFRETIHSNNNNQEQQQQHV